MRPCRAICCCVLIGCVTIAAAAGCGQKPAVSGAPAGDAAARRVAVVQPVRKTIRRSITQPGQVEAFDEARLYAKVAGYVEQYMADIGDPVKRGQLLAQLTAPELKEDLQQKRALVAQAGADIEQAQAAVKVAETDSASAAAKLKEARVAVDRSDAEYDRWKSEFDRVTQLVSRSAITPKLAEETKAQMLAAAATRRGADAQIESARAVLTDSDAQIDKARADEVAMRARRVVAEADEARALAMLEYLKIEAPFDGTVSQRNADIGYFAQPADRAQTQPLFTVVRIDQMRVFVDLPEMDAALADVGDRAVVRVQSLADRDFAGKVTRTSWALDTTSRTLRTEVDVPNVDGTLRPGMYARVTIDLAERENALVVPASAIFTQDDRSWCAVIDAGKAVRHAVGIGIKSGNEVEIVSGLDDVQQVVLTGGASLSDGQAVEVLAPAAGN
jgi:HlyD family secretion protein